MALITSTEILKKYVSGFNKQTNIDKMMAWLDKAERKYLIPVIGQEMYEYLLTAGDDTELCVNAQRVVAWYGYYMSLPHLDITPGDLGLKILSTANTTEIPKWKYIELLRSAADMADDEMEYLLQYLFGESGSDIPQWENSEAAQQCKSTFFTSAVRLTMVVPIVKSRYRTFLELSPYLLKAQEKLEPILTSEVLEQIRAANLADPLQLLTTESKLLDYCRKFIAPMAALDALVDSKLKLYPDGLKTTTYEDSFGQQPTGTQERIIEEQQEKLQKQIIEAQTALKAYIDRTASETVFPSYYQRKISNPKPDPLFLTNANQKSFFL